MGPIRTKTPLSSANLKRTNELEIPNENKTSIVNKVVIPNDGKAEQMKTRLVEHHIKRNRGPPNYCVRGFTSSIPLLLYNKYTLSSSPYNTSASLAASLS